MTNPVKPVDEPRDLQVVLGILASLLYFFATALVLHVLGSVLAGHGLELYNLGLGVLLAAVGAGCDRHGVSPREVRFGPLYLLVGAGLLEWALSLPSSAPDWLPIAIGVSSALPVCYVVVRQFRHVAKDPHDLHASLQPMRPSPPPQQDLPPGGDADPVGPRS